MKALIVCLYITTAVAWPSGVYILDDYPSTSNQYYNPLTQPYSQVDLSISFRGYRYAVAGNVCGHGGNVHRPSLPIDEGDSVLRIDIATRAS